MSFTDEQHKMLVDLAKSKGFSKSAIVVLALEEYLKMQNKERHKKSCVGRTAISF